MSEYLGPLFDVCGNGERWGWSWNWANDYVVAETIFLPSFVLRCGVQCRESRELCMGGCVSLPDNCTSHSVHSLLLLLLFPSENANGVENGPELCKHSLW